jgi:hypothetical protein
MKFTIISVLLASVNAQQFSPAHFTALQNRVLALERLLVGISRQVDTNGRVTHRIPGNIIVSNVVAGTVDVNGKATLRNDWTIYVL